MHFDVPSAAGLLYGRIEMAFTENSTIAEIMKKANARELIAKHAGYPIDEGQLQMAMGMSIKQVANFVGWGNDKVAAFLKDLNA